ncbi:MAG: hypothetical protein HC800_23030 [Phormidesmis sp. RL_2_1]|nr:hypothetical protein [Phormidesmis sp. RL_2_1]
MVLLTGIKAFEARWQSLRANDSANAADSRLLMQSMGRLVDNYASQAEISQELPASLQGVFARLVDAYLNGYWLEDGEQPSRAVVSRSISPAMLAAKQLRQHKAAIQPTAASEAATYIIRDRTSLVSSIQSTCIASYAS